jgi:hypothetical protein
LAAKADPPLKPADKNNSTNEANPRYFNTYRTIQTWEHSQHQTHTRSLLPRHSPKEYCAQNNIAGIVWLIRQTLGPISATFAQVNTDGESSGSTGNVDGCSSGEVETAEQKRPSLGVPCPTRDGVLKRNFHVSTELHLCVALGLPYTIVLQTNTKTSNGPRRPRSATAPMAIIGLDDII